MTARPVLWTGETALKAHLYHKNNQNIILLIIMDGLTMLISTPRQALLPLFGVKTPGSARHSQYW